MKVMKMRKEYKKPILLYEDFRLMEAIANSCALEGQHDNKYTCAWWNPDFQTNIFDTRVVAACQIDEIAVEVPQDVVFPS